MNPHQASRAEPRASSGIGRRWSPLRTARLRGMSSPGFHPATLGAVALNPDLAASLRIQNMAERAASDVAGDTPPYSAAYEAAQAYIRLRAEGRSLAERALWSVEAFDSELPEPDFGELDDPSEPMHPRNAALDGMRVGPRARVLLNQLAGWAAGNVEAFKIEAGLKADADAKVAAEQGKRGPAGFAP
jgi:hypothetical protein